MADKNRIKLAVGAVALIAIILLPVSNVTIVPEWSLKLIEENGEPAANIRVQQNWKDYSFEFFRAGEHTDDTARSDSAGIVSLPKRTISVSIFDIVSARIRDFIAAVNPHCSYGPHSYILCRDSVNCVAYYHAEEELPQLITVKR